MATSAEIYGFIVARSRTAELPGIWRRFSAHPSCLHPPADATALFADLRQEFSADDLSNSRVVVSTDDGVRLHPGLADAESVFIALQPIPSELPVDLVFGTGSTLAGCRLPVLSALRHDHMYLGGQHNMLVAASMPDVAVLRSLGFAAVPVTGLDRLGGRGLDEFRSLMDGPSGDPSTTHPAQREIDGRTPGPTVVLVGWQPSGLAGGVPPEIKHARRHLRDIEQHLDVNLDFCVVWHLPADVQRQIRFARRFGRSSNIRQALYASYKFHCLYLGDVPSGPPQPPSYSDLRNLWNDAVARGDGDASERARRDLQKLFEQDVVDPLLKDAENANDINERLLLISLAQVAGVRHDQAQSMAAYFSIGANRTPLAKRVLPSEQFKQQQVMLRQILELTAKIVEWRSAHANRR